MFAEPPGTLYRPVGIFLQSGVLEVMQDLYHQEFTIISTASSLESPFLSAGPSRVQGHPAPEGRGQRAPPARVLGFRVQGLGFQGSGFRV